MKRLLPLVLLLAACGGNPRPQPPVVNPPAPVVNPSPVPNASASPRPPRPSPATEPDGGTPIPPMLPTLTICHVYDREGEQDRGQQTLTLPRERAEWHLEHHRKNGDHAGKCGEREGS